jgi:hypothetical protein
MRTVDVRLAASTDSPASPSLDLMASAQPDRSGYSKVLGERLRMLARQLRAHPGDPNLRKALNDALAEARRNKTALVEGAALVEADHALAAAKPIGPPSASGAALMRQVDPISSRGADSRVLEAELNIATRRYASQPTAQNWSALNNWLQKARTNPDAVVSLDVLKQADRSLAGGQPRQASRRPVEQWVDLSSVPGAAGGNYVGIESRGQNGQVTRLQVRLRARMQMNDSGQWTVRQIQAVGPQVTRDGKTMSERFKVYEIRDASGRPIIDLDQARHRAREMLRHGGISTLSDEQRAMLVKAEKPRPIVGSGPQRWEAPNIRYSPSPDQPNRMRGPAPPPHTVERTGFNVAWQTESTNPAPTHAAMFVPNVVFELGPKKVSGKPWSLFGVTPQPVLGFFPTSGGFAGYRQRTDDSALVRTTVHPAGFYPGDRANARWGAEWQQRPGSTPALRSSEIGYRSHIDTSKWYQIYLNVPNMFTPWVGSSLNARAIGNRQELRWGAYQQSDVFAIGKGKAKEFTQFVMTPYTWVQSAFKAGVPNFAHGNRAAYGTAHAQAEIGFYVYNTTNTQMPMQASTRRIDWRIVNGTKTGDPAKIAGQFADVRQQFGITLRSESVLPHWDDVNTRDRSAGVYVQVPAGSRGTAEEMATKLQEIGRALPAYKELRFVTAEQLAALNPSVRSGGQTAGTERWLNTGLRVSVGGSGLFLPEDRQRSIPE